MVIYCRLGLLSIKVKVTWGNAAFREFTWPCLLSHGSQTVMGLKQQTHMAQLTVWPPDRSRYCLCEHARSCLSMLAGMSVKASLCVSSVWTGTLAQGLFEVCVCLCLFEICSRRAPRVEEETERGCHELCHKTNNPSAHTSRPFLVCFLAI